MLDIATRLGVIEDRMALYDVLLAYYTAVDSLDDVDGLVDCFTEDGLFDLTGLGLARIEGHAAIRAFFERVFADMTHHAHFLTNFRISRLAAEEATGHAYVIGMGRAKTGMEVLVHAGLDIDYIRTAAGWKMRAFVEGARMPLPGEVAAIHDR